MIGLLPSSVARPHVTCVPAPSGLSVYQLLAIPMSPKSSATLMFSLGVASMISWLPEPTCLWVLDHFIT